MNLPITSTKVEDGIISINCPYCDSKEFILKKTNIAEHIDRGTEMLNEKYLLDDDRMPEFEYSGNFVGIIICKKCREQLQISGTSLYSFDIEYDDENSPYQEWYMELNIQRYFPSPVIINLPSNIPKEFDRYLKKVFNLYWIDINSCANAIRIFLEILMDYKKVRKIIINRKNIKIRIDLHQRIELCFKHDVRMKEIGLAIKKLGNAGSHNGTINNEDINNLLELLEYILGKLFNIDKDKSMHTLAKRILKK